MNTLFPIFVKAGQLHTLIVGGGYVGLEKATALLGNSPDARVTLVAPEIRSEIYELATQHAGLMLVVSRYDETFLAEKQLVIVGTNDKGVNRQVQQDCKRQRILVNVADTPDLCDFYLSSVVKKGDLKLPSRPTACRRPLPSDFGRCWKRFYPRVCRRRWRT